MGKISRHFLCRKSRKIDGFCTVQAKNCILHCPGKIGGFLTALTKNWINSILFSPDREEGFSAFFSASFPSSDLRHLDTIRFSGLFFLKQIKRQMQLQIYFLQWENLARKSCPFPCLFSDIQSCTASTSSWVNSQVSAAVSFSRIRFRYA